MTNKTAWAHLPNARHIDWVLADSKARPQAWGDAWEARLVNRAGAFDAAHNVVRDAAWYSARMLLRGRGVACHASRDAISALVAWDHAGDLLAMTAQQLRAHIELSKDHAAILLLPAVVARESAVKPCDSAPERHAQEIAAYELTVSNLRAELAQKGREDFQAGYEAGVYDAKYVDAACANQEASKMADFFMGWALPKDFSPDCGISFDGREDDEWNKNKMWPTGTNLFTHEQAKTLFEHMLAAAPQPAEQQTTLDAVLDAARLVLSNKRGDDDWLILIVHAAQLEDAIAAHEAKRGAK